MNKFPKKKISFLRIVWLEFLNVLASKTSQIRDSTFKLLSFLYNLPTLNQGLERTRAWPCSLQDEGCSDSHLGSEVDFVEKSGANVPYVVLLHARRRVAPLYVVNPAVVLRLEERFPHSLAIAKVHKNLVLRICTLSHLA